MTGMYQKNDNDGHRERLRQRFERVGIDGLQDYEIFELLLSFVIPRCDVKQRGKNLIKAFKTPSGILNAPINELMKIEGIGKSSALMLKLVNELCGVVLAEKIEKRDIISSPDAVRDFCRVKLGGETREVFMVIFLNTKNHVIKHQILQKGTVDHAAIYPREIATAALECLATGVILVHNHPSGDCSPSGADLKMTQTVNTTLAAVGIKLLDHLIVSNSDYLSLAEKTLI